jgi:DNA-binding NarL/FixJ family response regulator
MTNATTFVLADADLSVPAGAIDIDRTTAEARFFGLLREAKPDVILLDLTDGNGAGPEAIRTIRLKCRVPILVVCDINDRRLFEYRVAGATVMHSLSPRSRTSQPDPDADQDHGG